MFSMNMLLLIQTINSTASRTNLFCRFWETDSVQELPKLQALFNMQKWISAIAKQISAAFLPAFACLFSFLSLGKRNFKNGWLKLLGFFHEASQERKFVNKEREDRSSWILKPAPITIFSVIVGQLCGVTYQECFFQANNGQKIASRINLAFHLWKTYHLFSVCSHYWT